MKLDQKSKVKIGGRGIGDGAGNDRNNGSADEAGMSGGREQAAEWVAEQAAEQAAERATEQAAEQAKLVPAAYTAHAMAPLEGATAAAASTEATANKATVAVAEVGNTAESDEGNNENRTNWAESDLHQQPQGDRLASDGGTGGDGGHSIGTDGNKDGDSEANRQQPVYWSKDGTGKRSNDTSGTVSGRSGGELKEAEAAADGND